MAAGEAAGGEAAAENSAGSAARPAEEPEGGRCSQQAQSEGVGVAFSLQSSHREAVGVPSGLSRHRPITLPSSVQGAVRSRPGTRSADQRLTDVPCRTELLDPDPGFYGPGGRTGDSHLQRQLVCGR